mgnify:CR=1 FL=1
MKPPAVELVPLRPAVRSDAPTALDVLVRITPPAVEAAGARPALNLGLVIDRSGSMGGQNKIGYARDAAAFAVRELAPTDRVSLTIFDDKVETLAASGPAADRDRLLRLIAGIHPGGSTALHGGWAEGAKQVAGHLVAGGLNRVLLLSDGLANVGESRPDAICTDVHAASAKGVSTTALGLGNDYNEDLLEAMARSGDGNYYYVESPRQLAAIFRTELRGLSATVGTDALLALEPGLGVAVADVLNDLDRDPDGRCRLPNLVSGFPVLVVLRLEIPPASGECRVLTVRLEWTAPCTGARARELAQTAGIDLPVEPQRRQIVWAKSEKNLPANLPMVIDIGSGFHFRPARDFNDSAHEFTDEVFFAYPDPDEKSSLAANFDESFIAKVYERARHRSPFLFATKPIRERCRAGLYENSPDHHAILGGCREIEGLYFANGFSGHGVMHSPATGRALAEIILDGRASFLDVSSLHFERFARGKLLHETAFI